MLRPSRLARRWWAGGLIAALLFLQLATAAYACPQLNAATATMAGMPCADSPSGGPMRDEAHPGLCAEHCKAGAMNVDPGHAPDVPLPAPASLRVVSPEPSARTLAAPWSAHARQRNRAPPPTHAALHCCYRT